MTKKELSTIVANQLGRDREEVERVLNASFKVIQQAVNTGDNYYHRGFGSFVKVKRADKTARNISKGTKVIVPAHYVPVFKPSRDFKKLVK